jgi:hypothetical protein
MASGAWLAAAVVGAGSLVVPALALLEAGRAQGAILEAVTHLSEAPAEASEHGALDAAS